MKDSLALFHGPNAGYALDLYEQYRRDPASVDAQTRALFDLVPLSITPDVAPSNGALAAPVAPATTADYTASGNAARLARNIRGRGHLAACVDPLGATPVGDRGLEAEPYDLRAEDMAAIPADVIGGPVAQGARNALEALDRLRDVYQGTTGYDYNHLQSAKERLWLREAIESRRFHAPLADGEKRSLLESLTQVEAFERFLAQAFQNQKRFSIEGVDMLIPMLDDIIRAAAATGTREVVMGMAHRGRLNVLSHVLDKPYEKMLAEFREAISGEGPAPTEGINSGWTGDVKYHLGATGVLREGDEARVKLTLANNPSHLEYVDPVIEGMARAVQDDRTHPGEPEQHDVAALPVLMHGDAAFPGEGVVAETLNLSRLPGYRTGGTVHLILNNGLGFTTNPEDARSTLYASDLAKGFEIPIIHVNADDPEACIAAARLAHAYREEFHKDVLIDLVGYRRWGHNEGDEPAFTQPLLYEKIQAHPTVRAQWAERLGREGPVPPDEAQHMLDAAVASLREINRSIPASGLSAEDDRVGAGDHPAVTTAVPAERLREYNEALLAWPEGFAPHRRLLRQLEARRAALDPDGRIEWGLAETLACAAILADGTPIRLSGQDTERGTFGHRHLVLHDAATGHVYTPMQHLPQARASFAVYNSPLSEAGALGFEYGYSVHAPEALVLWEAQYGDFANAAQVITDQFIAAARAKWRQGSSLTLLLPHGYEGNGPEHSSARLERYLQLAAQDNLRVASPTTSGQYFHLLRRQAALLCLDPRPLVVMTPKSLLRSPRAASRLEDLAEGTFRPVIDDAEAAERRDEVTRLVLCSGKVYVDLAGSDQREATLAVAIARIEQIYPFPEQDVCAVLSAYRNLREIVWVQEEPRNMGAWAFIAPCLRALAGRELALNYVGRPERASPAVGSPRVHAAEQASIIADAFAGVRPLQKT